MKEIFILLISIIITFSCKNKENNSESVVMQPSMPSVEIPSNTDSIIYQLDSNTIAFDGDTLHIEAPFIYSFDGILNTKKIQIHLTNLVVSEYGGYYKSASVYIDGAVEIYYALFIENPKTKIWTADVEDYYANQSDKQKTICKLKLYNLAQENMYIECLYKNNSYNIYPSTEFPKYKCFDKIDYTLYDSQEAFKKEEAMRPFTPNRDYSFCGEIISNNKYYDKLQSEVKYLYSDSSDIDSHKSWKHQFHIAKASNEDDLYSTESLAEVTPIYIDSIVYVLSDFSYSYMGGAHGMMATYYKNYNVQTGKIIKLSELIYLSEKFYKFYQNVVKSTYKDMITDEVDKITTTDNFFILPTGITFSYAPYELLGFAAGEPHIFLDYEELDPFIKQNSILNNYLK